MDLDFLTKLYNTLMLIQTSGDNTILMGDCLKALRKYIEDQSNSNKTEEV